MSTRSLMLSASTPATYHPAGVRARWRLAGFTALLIVLWLGAVLLFDSVRFVIFNPQGKTGFEMFLALGQLFGSLVLALSPVEPAQMRMRWVATGLLILGLGALGFGYLYPLLVELPRLNVTMYGSLVVRSLATVMLAIGMVPSRVPRLGRRGLITVLMASAIIGMVVVLFGNRLPPLVEVSDIETILATSAKGSFPGLTGWHLGLGSIPLAAGVAAAWGTVHHYQGKVFGGWLVVAVVFLAGAQLHSMFWPSMYSSALTTTTVLRFGLTVVIIVGGIHELRSLSLERSALLAEEQERVRQLEELGELKRDFTSIVAHELVTPLAVIANLAQMISMGALPSTEQQKAAGRIQAEARILQLLVQDIQASADIERDDFSVRIRPVSLDSLLGNAETYARTVQSDHPLSVDAPSGITVAADPERIEQVIRNLLNNAIRHTPGGTPITLRALPLAGGVRIEIADAGPGIDPADRAVILEKYGRGHGSRSDGRGLGLYLSRRILQAHDTDLTIQSKPGHGACFSFILREGG